MRVTQVCIGRFHHFHLARHLNRSGDLQAIYTGYPWFKLRDEGIPRHLVHTVPWLQTPYMSGLLAPMFRASPAMKQAWEWRSKELLDKHASKKFEDCDVVVGLSGSALRVGKTAQSRGARFVCDRGSTHICFQNDILREEHTKWRIPWRGIDQRVIEKECQEYAAADLITVPSDFVKDSFVSQGVPASKLAKVPYGANIARFSPQGVRSADRFIVLFVGQLSLRKGAPYLFEALANFRHPGKELWIVGSRDRRIDPILSKHNSLPIRWLGTVPNAKLAEIYSQAHAFVLPSIEEGLAMVNGEALACGCPVIASVNTGASDLFEDAVEGFIVPVRDPSAITERLALLAEDPDRWHRMSAAGVRRARTIGGWQSYGTAYRSHLANLCNALD